MELLKTSENFWINVWKARYSKWFTKFLQKKLEFGLKSFIALLEIVTVTFENAKFMTATKKK